MSSVSSVSSAAQGLFQFIQSLAGTSQSQATGATAATGASTSTSPTQAGQPVEGGHHHHHHGQGGPLKQIQDAVTSALQTAQSNGSSSDPNQIIEDAIAQVLKGTGAGSSTTTGQATTSNPTATGGTPATGQTATTTNSSVQSFFQTLQAAGVNPQQFRQDFLAAIKDAQSGQANAATAFQSFPIGSTLDTIG